MTKILTVDDSKAVRMVVRKTFKDFDCEIIEASNGVEGLATAGREDPDIILLDVTMPVMDGVEMLTKLKTDPKTKGIPVIMLTAEAGRDNVLRIAKIGIRDYIVKPFQDKTLVDKVDRIIDLRPKGEKEQKRKSIHDACEIMIVEDNELNMKLFNDLLATQGYNRILTRDGLNALDLAREHRPDLILMDIQLPEVSGLEVTKWIKDDDEISQIPIVAVTAFAMKGDEERIRSGGCEAYISKPISVPLFLETVRQFTGA